MLNDCIDHGKRGNKAGYAQRMIKYKNYYLHRLVMADKLGVEVTTLQGVVMHLCNNPRCINPAHLKLGTQSENVQQAFREGRKVSNCKRKLTAVDIKDIRLAYSSGVPNSTLASKYKVSRSTICDITQNRTWNKPT